MSRTLKNALKPHLQKPWCIPPLAHAEFVAGMEHVPRPFSGHMIRDT